jgi:hypothetical protein
MDEIVFRVKRIYAAINASHEFNMAKFPVKVFSNTRGHGFFQDFSGGQSEEELANIAHAIIYNIANLRDHLRRWADQNGKGQARVWEYFKGTDPLKIIQDLSNYDKHGPPENGKQSWTGLEPRLRYIRRIMQLTTQAKAGSCVALTFDRNGGPQLHGDGSACGVVTAEVLDKDGNLLGDLARIQLAAVEAWELLLAEFGVPISK